VKKAIVPLLALAVITLGLYYFFSLQTQEKLDPWRLIPRKSFAVWEVSKLKIIDSIVPYPPNQTLQGLLTGKAKDEKSFYLQAFQLVGDGVETLILFDKFQLNQDSLRPIATRKTRLYEGKEIIEFRVKNVSLALTTMGEISVLSTSSLMLEETIRQYRTQSSSFKDEHISSFGVPNLKNDAGNLYLDWFEFSKVLKLNSTLASGFTLLSQLSRSVVFDFQVTGKDVLFSGFGLDSARGKFSLLSLFRDQQPVPLQLINFVPDQFDFLVHLGLSNPVMWYDHKLTHYQKDTALTNGLTRLRDQFLFSDKDFWTAVDNEIVKVANDGDEALFVEMKGITKAASLFGSLEKQLDKKNLHREEVYSDYTVHTFDLVNFGYALFSPFLAKSRQISFLFMDQVLVLSSNEKFLKELIDQIEKENTIGKSLPWRKFLSNTQQESSLSVLLNNAPDLLMGPEGSRKGVPFSFDKLSIQFTRLDKNFYASSFLSSSKKSFEPKRIATTEREYNGSSARSNLYPVTNHTTREPEILFQDNQNKLLLLDIKGQVLWGRELDSKIIESVYQVDFFENGKLQYLLATQNSLYVMDFL
jgi:hypothetical protein